MLLRSIRVDCQPAEGAVGRLVWCGECSPSARRPEARTSLSQLASETKWRAQLTVNTAWRATERRRPHAFDMRGREVERSIRRDERSVVLKLRRKELCIACASPCHDCLDRNAGASRGRFSLSLPHNLYTEHASEELVKRCDEHHVLT